MKKEKRRKEKNEYKEKKRDKEKYVWEKKLNSPVL
jgi:hypothetical protein